MNFYNRKDLLIDDYGFIKKAWRELPLAVRLQLLDYMQKIFGDVAYIRLVAALDAGPLRSCVKSSGVLFIHVPKAAGTSVSRAIYGTSIGHSKAVNIKAANCELFNQLYKFSVIRDPWSRLVSSHRFIKNSGTNEVFIRKAKRHKDIPENFRNFVLDWLCKKKLDDLNIVFTQQSDFIFDNSDLLLVDEVFEIGNLDSLQFKLSSMLGRNITFDHLNVTDGGKRLSDIYDYELIDVVSDLYHRDIKLLGFDVNDYFH